MKDTINTILGGLITGVIVGISIIFLTTPQITLNPIIETPVGFSATGLQFFSTTATSGSVVLTSSNTKLLGTSTGNTRQSIIFTAGPSCPSGAYISFANDAAATAGNSVFVSASSSLRLNQDFAYNGAVNAISAAGNCTLNTTGR